MEIDDKTEKKSTIKRIIVILIFLIIFIISIVIYSRFIVTSMLDVNEYKIVNSKVPDSFHGLKIVHFSDLHYGGTVHKKELANVVDKINYIKPDIVVFTGDLIDKNILITDEIKNIIKEELSRINAKLGKYTIIGNHDYNKDYFYEIMENTNFTILKNEFDIIYNELNEYIFLGGVDDALHGEMDIKKTLEYFDIKNDDSKNSIDENIFKIILIHEPDYIDEFVNDYDIDVIMAGHSHNGQIRLPYVRPLILPKGAKKYYSSHYKINDTDLFVSNGIGTSTFYFRLFNRPSINFYRICNN